MVINGIEYAAAFAGDGVTFRDGTAHGEVTVVDGRVEGFTYDQEREVWSWGVYRDTYGAFAQAAKWVRRVNPPVEVHSIELDDFIF